jgi:hypothetical protein
MERSVRLTHGSARILQVLARPGIRFEQQGTRTLVSWDDGYDQRILAQSEAPGFPFADRVAIRAAIHGDGRGRVRGSEAAARWAQVHAAEAAGRPIAHPRAFVFGHARDRDDLASSLPWHHPGGRLRRRRARRSSRP